MSGFLPPFLQRQLQLSRARRALTEGDPERALELLAHPSLALSPSADRVRARVLESLWRTASRKSRNGRTGSVARLIDLVARENPESAEDWTRRLMPSPAGATTESRTVGRQDAPSRATRLIERLLEEVHGFVQSSEGDAAAGSSSAGEPARKPEPASAARPAQPVGAPSDAHFQLAVDDAGEYLVACRPSLVIGHSRGGKADLPFFSDLESAHARLVLEESFHGGPRWVLEGLVENAFEVVGEGATPTRHTLEDQDEIKLGANLAFRYVAPDPASSSAILMLLHGAECSGASRVLLFCEGRAGRVRMGARTSRHFAVPGLEEEVVLFFEAGRLFVESDAIYRTTPELEGSGTQPARIQVPCPPETRIAFLGAPRGEKRPPFSFSIAPRTTP